MQADSIQTSRHKIGLTRMAKIVITFVGHPTREYSLKSMAEAKVDAADLIQSGYRETLDGKVLFIPPHRIYQIEITE